MVSKTFLLLILLTLTGMAAAVNGQSSAAVKAPLIYRSTKVTGWNIPQVDKTKEFSENELLIQNVRVKERRYEGERFNEKPLDLYSQRDDGTVEVTTLSADLQTLSRLEVSGKIFAYCAIYFQVATSEKAGKAYFGPPIRIYFVDGDGDGLFESRYYCPTGEFDKIPDWVLRQN